jgi:hypothetical protein
VRAVRAATATLLSTDARVSKSHVRLAPLPMKLQMNEK